MTATRAIPCLTNDPYCVPGQPGNQNGCPGTPPPPAAMPADASQAKRFNVTRIQPIGIGYPSRKSDQTTPATNARLPGIAGQGGPQLAVAVLPTGDDAMACSGKYSGQSGFYGILISRHHQRLSYVPTGCSFANVTMETFDQDSVSSGCMSCHNCTAHPKGPRFAWEMIFYGRWR